MVVKASQMDVGHVAIKMFISSFDVSFSHISLPPQGNKDLHQKNMEAFLCCLYYVGENIFEMDRYGEPYSLLLTAPYQSSW